VSRVPHARTFYRIKNKLKLAHHKKKNELKHQLLTEEELDESSARLPSDILHRRLGVSSSSLPYFRRTSSMNILQRCQEYVYLRAFPASAVI
jgi:hypothetical protein